jgi:hypothetical protein
MLLALVLLLTQDAQGRIRPHTSAYVRIRQQTSAYASIPEGRDCEVALDDGAGDEEASGARIELYIHRRERSVSICTFVPVEQVN